MKKYNKKIRSIFILGNGFDLAHYLPTQYIHFMEAMEIVECWDLNKSIYFSELFYSRLTRKDSFILNTQKLYKTTEPIIYYNDAAALKNKLIGNFWYKHFKNHLNDIVTWIDFESEIEKTLLDIVQVLNTNFDIDTISNNKTPRHNDKFISNNFWEKFGAIGLMYREIFQNLNIISTNETDLLGQPLYSIDITCIKAHGGTYLGFYEEEILQRISGSLEDFKNIFQKYISLVINKLEPKVPFHPFGDLGKEIEAVFTFNYSNSFERFYPKSLPIRLDIQYIHGNAEAENIVLGISDLSESLKKYKIFNFVKSYQSIIQHTDYQTICALSNYLSHEEDISFELLIWGHSLDISDKKYILEILTTKKNVNWESHIWYFDKPHSYLANLMNILGEDSTLKKIMDRQIILHTPAPDILKLNKHII